MLRSLFFSFSFRKRDRVGNRIGDWGKERKILPFYLHRKIEFRRSAPDRAEILPRHAVLRPPRSNVLIFEERGRRCSPSCIVDSLEWVFNPAMDSSGNNIIKREEKARGEERPESCRALWKGAWFAFNKYRRPVDLQPATTKIDASDGWRVRWKRAAIYVLHVAASDADTDNDRVQCAGDLSLRALPRSRTRIADAIPRRVAVIC